MLELVGMCIQQTNFANIQQVMAQQRETDIRFSNHTITYRAINRPTLGYKYDTYTLNSVTAKSLKLVYSYVYTSSARNGLRALYTRTNPQKKKKNQNSMLLVSALKKKKFKDKVLKKTSHQFIEKEFSRNDQIRSIEFGK